MGAAVVDRVQHVGGVERVQHRRIGRVVAAAVLEERPVGVELGDVDGSLRAARLRAQRHLPQHLVVDGEDAVAGVLAGFVERDVARVGVPLRLQLRGPEEVLVVADKVHIGRGAGVGQEGVDPELRVAGQHGPADADGLAILRGLGLHGRRRDCVESHVRVHVVGGGADAGGVGLVPDFVIGHHAGKGAVHVGHDTPPPSAPTGCCRWARHRRCRRSRRSRAAATAGD